MKVIFDARWIPTDGKYNGVGRYSHELAHAFAKQTKHSVTWLICHEKQKQLLPKGDCIMANNPDDILREIHLKKKLEAYAPDIVYSPLPMIGLAGKSKVYKLILTVHDLIPFEYNMPPHWLPWYTRIGWLLFHCTKFPMRLMIKSADTIATVSETAKNDLQRFKLTKKPITVVRNAVSHTKKPVITNHYDSHDVIYMGAFTKYKNVECVILALKHLPDVTLHLLSKLPKKRRPELMQFIKNTGVKKQIVFHNGVSDDEYFTMLRKARCLVSASRIEGFGLPLLEAQQYGTPVVCSDIPIFHEVTGNSALYFNPDSPEECAKAIAQYAKKPVNESHIKQGLENARIFNWCDSATVAESLCDAFTPKTS